MTDQVSTQTNFIEALYQHIENQLQTARAHNFEKLHAIAMAPSKYDDDTTAWYGYYFWANLGFQNMEPDEYLTWATEMQREEPTLSGPSL
jgi:hypothetical protein